jgi:hypothetical protein
MRNPKSSREPQKSLREGGIRSARSSTRRNSVNQKNPVLAVELRPSLDKSRTLSNETLKSHRSQLTNPTKVSLAIIPTVDQPVLGTLV